MQDIGGAPAPANPAAVYSEVGGAAGSAEGLPDVSETVDVDDDDEVSYVLSLCVHSLFYTVNETETFCFIIYLKLLDVWDFGDT